MSAPSPSATSPSAIVVRNKDEASQYVNGHTLLAIGSDLGKPEDLDHLREVSKYLSDRLKALASGESNNALKEMLGSMATAAEDIYKLSGLSALGVLSKYNASVSNPGVAICNIITAIKGIFDQFIQNISADANTDLTKYHNIAKLLKLLFCAFDKFMELGNKEADFVKNGKNLLKKEEKQHLEEMLHGMSSQLDALAERFSPPPVKPKGETLEQRFDRANHSMMSIVTDFFPVFAGQLAQEECTEDQARDTLLTILQICDGYQRMADQLKQDVNSAASSAGEKISQLERALNDDTEKLVRLANARKEIAMLSRWDDDGIRAVLERNELKELLPAQEASTSQPPQQVQPPKAEASVAPAAAPSLVSRVGGSLAQASWAVGGYLFGATKAVAGVTKTAAQLAGNTLVSAVVMPLERTPFIAANVSVVTGAANWAVQKTGVGRAANWVAETVAPPKFHHEMMERIAAAEDGAKERLQQNQRDLGELRKEKDKCEEISQRLVGQVEVFHENSKRLMVIAVEKSGADSPEALLAQLKGNLLQYKKSFLGWLNEVFEYRRVLKDSAQQSSGGIFAWFKSKKDTFKQVHQQTKCEKAAVKMALERLQHAEPGKEQEALDAALDILSKQGGAVADVAKEAEQTSSEAVTNDAQAAPNGAAVATVASPATQQLVSKADKRVSDKKIAAWQALRQFGCIAGKGASDKHHQQDKENRSQENQPATTQERQPSMIAACAG